MLKAENLLVPYFFLPGDDAGYRQRSPAQWIVLFQSLEPLLVETDVTCREQRRVDEFRLQRIERAALLNGADEVFDKFALDAAIELRRFAAGGRRETGPGRAHASATIDDDAVKIGWTVHQRDAFDVGVPESKGSRQRQQQGIDRGDRAALVHELMIRLDADNRYFVARTQRLGIECSFGDRRVADERGVVRDHCKIVQRMQLDDLRVHLQRSCKCHSYVADGQRNGVAIHNDEAALGIDDDPGAVVVAVANAAKRIRQVEGHNDERRCDRPNLRVRMPRELSAARRREFRQWPGTEIAARPDARCIVARTAAHGEPDTIHLERPNDNVLRVVDRHVAQQCPRTVGESVQRLFEIVEVADLVRAKLGDYRTARHGGLRHQVTGIGNVDALDRQIVVTRLLIGELVDDGIANLQILGRRDRMQIRDNKCLGHRAAAALEFDSDLLADVVIEDGRQRHELGDQLTVDANQDIARIQQIVGRRTRDDLVDGQHPRLLGERGARGALGFLGQAEPIELIVGLDLERRLQSSAGDLLVVLQQVQYALNAIEREEKTGCCGVVRTGVERDNFALDVDDRRTRRTAGRARGSLEIERIEIVVLAAAVVRRPAVQPRDGACKNRQLFASVVADDANLAADPGAVRTQR